MGEYGFCILAFAGMIRCEPHQFLLFRGHDGVVAGDVVAQFQLS